MTPNEVMTPIQKADAALSDLVSDGGYVSERELPTFIKQSMLNAKLTPKVRRQLMIAQQMEIPRLRFNPDEYVLYPLVEGATHPVGERSSPDFGALNLTSVGFGGMVLLSQQILLNNVEHEQLVETIRQVVYPKIGADMEKIAIQGDITSAVPTLAALDGWLVKATAHTVAGAGARLSDALLGSALRALPEEYDMGAVEYMTSKKALHDWLDALKTRVGDLGDRAVTDKAAPNYRSYPVDKYPLWPSQQGVTTDRTTVLYTEPKNLVLGIQRDVKLSVHAEPLSRQTAIMFDVYMDAGFEVDDAVVAITDVLNS